MEQLQALIDGLTAAKDQETIKNRLAYIRVMRLRGNSEHYTIPFSDRLNEWVEKWFKDFAYDMARNPGGVKVVFTDEDDFDPNDIEGTFRRHRDLFFKENTINVWKGASDNNIFGSPLLNWMARAWHDYTHFITDRGYDSLDEIMVGKQQAGNLPENWWFEKALIDADVTGQILYHHKYSQFPTDQRKFVYQYLLTGEI